VCFKTFTRTNKRNKLFIQRHWFKIWVTENYSVHQVSKLSGYSFSKIKRIKNYWLEKCPPENRDLSPFKYLIFDGTYFHKDGCLMTLMHAVDQRIISDCYVPKEGFKSALRWFTDLKARGLDPLVITTDGEQSIIRAINLIWPHAIIQRCLYHIQHEGSRWLRTYPKTLAGKELKNLLLGLTSIRSIKERNSFIANYKQWLKSMKLLCCLCQ
jgi:hypothetical protein